MLKTIALVLGTILFVAVYVGLRVLHERNVQSWIDAGLCVRKPREFVRFRRYK